MSPIVYITKERTDSTFLPIRFAKPEDTIYVPTDMWRTNQTRLDQVHSFVVTNQPRVWQGEGYMDFEGVMFPPVDEDAGPPWGRLSWHGLKVYRYFVGLHHFIDGSIVEL